MQRLLRHSCRCAAATAALLATGLGVAGGSVSWTQKLDHGTFKGFPSFAQANELLEGWLRQHPGKLRKERIGESYEKRPIDAYVLATAAASAPTSSRPQVLFTALMHSREPASLTVVLYIIGHLLELFDQGNPEAVYLVSSREMWFIPFVNPDGYIANERSPTKPVIRKNRRPTCVNKYSSGVDINRNFAVAWKKGQFPACDEEYQGTAPFSEPETQALKLLCDRNSFKSAMNFHAFGSMLTHPYNWAPTAQRARLKTTDDDLVYTELQSVFKFDKFGPAIKTVGYTAPGESDDWFYDAKGIISMSPEVGPESGGFFPPASAVAGIDSRNYVRAMHLAVKSGLQLGTRWRLLPLGRSAQIPANHVMLELELRNSGLSSSAGDMLAVAVAGFADGAAEQLPPQHASVKVVPGHEGKPTEAQLYLAGGTPMVTFRSPVLPRRSKASIRFVLAGDWASSQARPLEVCVLETAAVAGAEALKVCQCSPPTTLAMSGSSEAVSNFGSLRFIHVGGMATDPSHLLCSRAAAAASTAFQPNSGDIAEFHPPGGGGQPAGPEASQTSATESPHGSAGVAASLPPVDGGLPSTSTSAPLPSGGEQGSMRGASSSGSGAALAGGFIAAGLAALATLAWLWRRCRQAACSIDDEESRPALEDRDGIGVGKHAVEPRMMGARAED